MCRLRSVVSFLIAGLAACQSPLVDGDDVVAIVGATLVDGTGSPARESTTIVTQAGRITHVVADGALRFGLSVETVEAGGYWVVPGYIDTHIHLAGAPTIAEAFEALLDHGITAARVAASSAERGLAVRDSVRRGDLRGPSLRVAGDVLDSNEWFWGGAPFVSIISTAEEARAEVRRQASAGVDYIKVYVHLSPEIVAAAVNEAHANGLKVIGHLGRTDWHQALDLGIDALTHTWHSSLLSSLAPPERRGSFREIFPASEAFDQALLAPWLEATELRRDIAEELGRRIAHQRVVLDPTLALTERELQGDEDLYDILVPEPYRRRYRPPASADWSATERERARDVFRSLLATVRTFHQQGALITAGSDMGNLWMTPGVAFHRELELLAQAGLSNLDVLTIATRNGAESLGLLGELGTVEVGKRANLVLLSADPLADIANTRRIVAVYQDGVRADRN